MESLKQILFIDIETAPCAASFDHLSENMQALWLRKAKSLKGSAEPKPLPDVIFEEKSGIFSEFAKVVCIGLGCLVEQEEGWKILLKSISGHDEKVLLNQFCKALTRFTDRFPNLVFCGHNIKEFDIPFLCRRMIIHRMSLPECMQLQGIKPWNIPHIDTLELWRFGDYKNYTALGLLAEVLGIPSPKDDIDGSMVGKVYWQEKNLERINRYCLQDVLTTAKIYLRLQNLDDIRPEPVFVSG